MGLSTGWNHSYHTHTQIKFVLFVDTQSPHASVIVLAAVQVRLL